MMKNRGFQANLPTLSPSGVGGDHAFNGNGTAQHGEQDAQNEREVARAHLCSTAQRVLAGAGSKAASHHREHQSGKEVFLTLDFHVMSHSLFLET